MRGTLPARNLYPSDFVHDKNAGQVVMDEGRDFIAVSGFAAIGLLLSLYLTIFFPASNEVMALFMQYP
jgi:hypothetical protein